MGESSEKDVPAWMESCKTNNITLTYTRHHWRSKIETRNRNEEEEEDETCVCIGHDSANVNVSEDEQVACLLSAFAPTPLLGHREVSKVVAPATPDINATDTKKRRCCRSLNFDLKRRARNDLMFEEETNDHYSQVEEDDPPRTPLVVYQRRKQVEEERDCQKREKESFDRQIRLFLTCMRDIQGEREFSEWRGSVTDSIVGAYLAQNVNDALSSSAFMSLAAKFPREAVGVSRRNEQKTICGKKDGCSKIPRQRIKTKNDPILLNVLKDCCSKYHSENKMLETLEAIDWDLVRMARVNDISEAIQIRGMNKNLAARIKDCLENLVKSFGSTDMEWIRDVPAHKAKEYLLSIYGLGLKSVECIRLLTLRQKAFPIDRNAGRVALRLGWVTPKKLGEGEEYPKKLNSIQMCLWPRLSHLEWAMQYELHCQIITFGKAICTKRDPNCYECPMRAECRHFASIQASAEVKASGLGEMDIEDYGLVRPITRFRTSKRASIPVIKKKKNVTSLRTEHQVYVLPNGHGLLAELELTAHDDDPCPYLLALWTPESFGKEPEEDAVYGTFLIPSRTATRGTFPLNGTFFQANEVLADYDSSEVPIRVPRASLMNLSSTTLYCGSSMSSICKGMTCVEVQRCFKSGFACLRGFDRETREPKPLPERFHNPKKRDNTK